MTEGKTKMNHQEEMGVRLDVLEHAKLRVLYLEMAVEADKSGLSETYRRYMDRSEEALKTHDGLKAKLGG